MEKLLNKTRTINKLLQKSDNIEFNKIACVLSDVMSSNSYIVSNDGAVLGHYLKDDFECDLMRDKVLNQGKFPDHYVEWLKKN